MCEVFMDGSKAHDCVNDNNSSSVNCLAYQHVQTLWKAGNWQGVGECIQRNQMALEGNKNHINHFRLI